MGRLSVVPGERLLSDRHCLI
uniref:Uncharacterized protein n=1 Tax=Anguilla anguilla TaxID=7936 RepID=A0A0E9SIZ8_ANGAN